MKRETEYGATTEFQLKKGIDSKLNDKKLLDKCIRFVLSCHLVRK